MGQNRKRGVSVRKIEATCGQSGGGESRSSAGIYAAAPADCSSADVQYSTSCQYLRAERAGISLRTNLHRDLDVDASFPPRLATF